MKQLISKRNAELGGYVRIVMYWSRSAIALSAYNEENGKYENALTLVIHMHGYGTDSFPLG